MTEEQGAKKKKNLLLALATDGHALFALLTFNLT